MTSTDPSASLEAGSPPERSPEFDTSFQQQLLDLFRWRRDVRRFRTDPLPDRLVRDLLSMAMLAPSVGLSEPWRYVLVNTPSRREAIRDIFRRCNHEALGDYVGERAKLYASLKLAGLKEAPLHMAVYCQQDPDQGHGLGRKTMPETLHYSVVSSIQTLWLAARAQGVGVGWVSILDPNAVGQVLDIPDDWTLIAYLCVGYPQEEHLDPELARHHWETRANLDEKVFIR
ncbi:MAG: 5,6-dimethylbenzimidazole synthase [Pseudomonadota bacterium]